MPSFAKWASSALAAILLLAVPAAAQVNVTGEPPFGNIPGTLPLSKITPIANGTVVGNGSGSTASPIALTIGGGITLTSTTIGLTFGTAVNDVCEGGKIAAAGPIGSATLAPILTYDACGTLTAVSSATITPAIGSVTGLGSGVATALGDATNGTGGLVTYGGAFGNATGHASLDLPLTSASSLAYYKIPGTLGDCSGDDGAAIQSYVNGLMASGATADVYIGGNSVCYLIGTNASGADVLHFPHPVHFWGTALFEIASTTGTSTDIFHVDPATIADLSKYTFEDFFVTTASGSLGASGRHLFNLDTSASTTLQLEQPTIRYITEIVPVAGSYGITGGDFIHDTLASGEVSGQILRLIVEGNTAYHCINFGASPGIGDSPRLVRNAIEAISPGALDCNWNIKEISGAGSGSVTDNNFTANGGQIYNNGSALEITYKGNETEQEFTNTETNGAELDIQTGGGVNLAATNGFSSSVGYLTLHLNNITGVVVGQTVSNADLTGTCTVAAVSALSTQPWITLPTTCHQQTATIANGATIVISTAGSKTTTAAVPYTGGNYSQPLAIVNDATGTVIGPQRFAGALVSPLITNQSGATALTILPGQYNPNNATLLSDTGSGTVNLSTAPTVLGTTTYNTPSSFPFNVCDATTTIKCVGIGYDTADGFGFVQSVYVGNILEPLKINGSGGNVTIGSSGATETIGGAVDLPNITNAAGNEILCYDTTGGPVTYETAVAGCVPSDEHLKRITGTVNPFVAMWRVAWYLPSYYYKFKPATGLGDDNYIGLLAQDVCAMDAVLCRWDAKGDLNYDKIGLAAYVIAAIKGAICSIGILLVAAFVFLFMHARRNHRRLRARLFYYGINT